MGDLNSNSRKGCKALNVEWLQHVSACCALSRMRRLSLDFSPRFFILLCSSSAEPVEFWLYVCLCIVSVYSRPSIRGRHFLSHCANCLGLKNKNSRSKIAKASWVRCNSTQAPNKSFAPTCTSKAEKLKCHQNVSGELFSCVTAKWYQVKCFHVRLSSKQEATTHLYIFWHRAFSMKESTQLWRIRFHNDFGHRAAEPILVTGNPSKPAMSSEFEFYVVCWIWNKKSQSSKLPGRYTRSCKAYCEYANSVISCEPNSIFRDTGVKWVPITVTRLETKTWETMTRFTFSRFASSLQDWIPKWYGQILCFQRWLPADYPRLKNLVEISTAVRPCLRVIMLHFRGKNWWYQLRIFVLSSLLKDRIDDTDFDSSNSGFSSPSSFVHFPYTQPSCHQFLWNWTRDDKSIVVHTSRS